jgi:metal-responsive CopG/Arc/MetJ family transcriptional regulator
MWVTIHIIQGIKQMMRTVQMTIDQQLLEQVDEVVEATDTNRSAFIREALELALKKHRIRLLEKQDAEGYARIPARPEDGEIWLTEQAWGDEWNEVT